jgi:hypothetical protein
MGKLVISEGDYVASKFKVKRGYEYYCELMSKEEQMLKEIREASYH